MHTLPDSHSLSLSSLSSLLQSIGDSLKSDAIHHQSRIDTDEVNYLLSLTEESAKRFENLKGTIQSSPTPFY